MAGRRWSGLFVVLVFGCGATTRKTEPQPELTGGDAARSATSGAPSGGQPTTPAQPLAGGGGVSAGGHAGDPSLAGDGGTGGEEPCAGITPRCRPGEQACDPRLGKLGTCDSCGAVTNVDAEGPDCVRLLASDKESNGLCAVLGKDRLQCNPYPMEVITVSPDVVEVLVPDDYTGQGQPCVRFANGSYSCALAGCDGGRVALGETGTCTVCNEQLDCRDLSSDAPSVEQPLDVSITDGSAVVLSPLGVHIHGQLLALPAEWRGAPERFSVDHQGGGCVLSNEQELACWVETAQGVKASSWKGNFEKIIAATLPRACALDAARQLRCGDVFADDAPAPLGEPDAVDIVASSSVACALTVAGRVKCWDQTTSSSREVPAGW